MSFSDKILQKQFNLRVNRANGDLFDISKYEVLKEILASTNYFSLHPVVINADPFLFVKDDYLYVFYEEQIDLLGKGVVKMFKTNDLLNWSKPITVLEDVFHLSYPFVFQDKNKIFMLPETGNDRSVKLYTPGENLTQFTYYKTLLTGHNYVDSSIIFNDNKYYLFTTILDDVKNTLMLYFADSIEGKWQLHPSSPIAEGINGGRCGGAIFEYKNSLYRPTQSSLKDYGDGLIINKILELTTDNFIEETHKNVIPNSDNFYKDGGHHFNTCEFKGLTVVATDNLSKNLNVWEVCRRIINKIFKNDRK